jgi:hypothetical protein
MTDPQNLDWYLDEARTAIGAPSDRQLALALRVDTASLSAYRTKRAWPSPEVMVRLAELAKVSPEVALAQLASWRYPDVPTYTNIVELVRAVENGGPVWDQVRVTLRRGASALVLVLVFFFSNGGDGNSPALARDTVSAKTIHYATLAARNITRLLLRIKDFFTASRDTSAILNCGSVSHVPA